MFDARRRRRDDADGLVHCFVPIAYRTPPDQAGKRAFFQVGKVRLDVFDARGQDDRAGLPHLGPRTGDEISVLQGKCLDMGIGGNHAVQGSLFKQSLQ